MCFFVFSKKQHFLSFTFFSSVFLHDKKPQCNTKGCLRGSCDPLPLLPDFSAPYQVRTMLYDGDIWDLPTGCGAKWRHRRRHPANLGCFGTQSKSTQIFTKHAQNRRIPYALRNPLHRNRLHKPTIRHHAFPDDSREQQGSASTSFTLTDTENLYRIAERSPFVCNEVDYFTRCKSSSDTRTGIVYRHT